MEFALNIIYGGELNASKALSPFVRNMRKIIKDTFTSFENDSVSFFKLTLLFDGDIYKRQNKMFRFYKTFCSEFSIVNTKQNVHFATKKIEATYSVAFKL